MDYGLQQLGAAIRILAGPESQKERLIATLIPFFNIDPVDHLPEEIRGDFEAVQQKIDDARDGKASEVDIANCVSQIVNFYQTTCWYVFEERIAKLLR